MAPEWIAAKWDRITFQRQLCAVYNAVYGSFVGGVDVRYGGGNGSRTIGGIAGASSGGAGAPWEV